MHRPRRRGGVALPFSCSLSKAFRLTESKQIQVRFDATNVLNHPDPATPEFSINDDDFGTIASKGNQRRTFQGQLRFSF